MSDKHQEVFESLVNRCLQGDEEAWESLVGIITPVTFSLCRSMGLSQEESVEIFGQVCYLLLANLKRLQAHEKVVSYAATTARREILKLLHRAKLLDKIRNSELPIHSVPSSGNPEELFEAKQRGELLVKAVMKLPPREAKLIWHLFLDQSEPTYEEISKATGIPVSSIGPTRARGLAKLRRILTRMGYKF